jgi:hypothetical protein
MDATILYMIVELQNGELRTIDHYPTGSVARCREIERNVPSGAFVTAYMRAGAKAVRWYCAPRDKTLIIAR